MEGNNQKARCNLGEKAGATQGVPSKLPHKLGPKLNGYTKAQNDSQMEPSCALLFSPVKLQNAICLFLYISIDGFKYLSLF